MKTNVVVLNEMVFTWNLVGYSERNAQVDY